MRVKIVSDFHSCFWAQGNPDKFDRILNRYFPPAPEDYQTVLCCAGDMGTFATYASSYKPLFALLSKRFKHVIMCPGNHTWYSTAGVWGNEKDFWKDKKLPKNVHYLDNEFKVIDDVAFISSCMWTDFHNADPIAMFEAQRQMNDYQCIKKRNYEVNGVYGTVIDSSRLQPADTVQRFIESYAFIKSALKLHHDKKCVVITHTAPLALSVSEAYKGDTLNAAYYSDLSSLLHTYRPLLWVHGHMHDSKDYVFEDTRVLCNPLGYHAVQVNKQFNPDLTVELS